MHVLMKNRPSRKFVFMVLWGLFLSMNTWTSNLELMFDVGAVQFKWVPSPNYLSFFNLNDFTLIHPFFYIVKLGHYIGFAIMDLLLFNLTQKHKTSIFISILFAFFTEFLQLFFGRDGRLYDLIIDSLGVLSVYIFLKARKGAGPA